MSCARIPSVGDNLARVLLVYFLEDTLDNMAKLLSF